MTTPPALSGEKPLDDGQTDHVIKEAVGSKFRMGKTHGLNGSSNTDYRENGALNFGAQSCFINASSLCRAAAISL